MSYTKADCIFEVINEQGEFDFKATMAQANKNLAANPSYQGVMAFNQIEKSMSGGGTDEEGVKKGVFMIKNVTDYNACLNMKKITLDLITGKGKPVSYSRCSKKSIAL